MSDSELSGYYEFAYKSKFYLEGKINNDEFSELSIYWRDDLYFEGILTNSKKKMQGFFYFLNLIKFEVFPNFELKDYDETSFSLINNQCDHLSIVHEAKQNTNILKVYYKNLCLIKFKEEKSSNSITFCFYDYAN